MPYRTDAFFRFYGIFVMRMKGGDPTEVVHLSQERAVGNRSFKIGEQLFYLLKRVFSHRWYALLHRPFCG